LLHVPVDGRPLVFITARLDLKLDVVVRGVSCDAKGLGLGDGRNAEHLALQKIAHVTAVVEVGEENGE